MWVPICRIESRDEARNRFGKPADLATTSPDLPPCNTPSRSKPDETEARRQSGQLPQFLDIAQAVDLVKPVDIAEFADPTNCKILHRFVNPQQPGCPNPTHFLRLGPLRVRRHASVVTEPCAGEIGGMALPLLTVCGRRLARFGHSDKKSAYPLRCQNWRAATFSKPVQVQRDEQETGFAPSGSGIIDFTSELGLLGTRLISRLQGPGVRTIGCRGVNAVEVGLR